MDRNDEIQLSIILGTLGLITLVVHMVEAHFGFNWSWPIIGVYALYCFFRALYLKKSKD